jgi:exonuclease SbcC
VRPIRLTVQGFAAFRDRVEVDFEDVDFFALVGPTGSGKSSIIDAMCFALYGNVPRYEDQRRVGFAIAIQSLEARVSLVFEVGGERYVAARVVRRTSQGGATTREARLERYIDSEATETRASGPREVNEAVEQVLGLPFEHFTKCVVLPQGEFARFLHDRPADRQELLVRLLDLGRYARMGSKARERATQADATARLCEQRLESLADATDAAKVKAEARLAALKDLRAQVDRARLKLTELERSIETLTTTATAANAFATRLATVGVPPEVTALAEQLQAATEERHRQQEDLQQAEAALAKLAQAAGEQPPLGPLQATLSAHAELERCRQQLVRASEVLQRAQDEERRLDKERQEADEAVQAARARLHDAEREHSAHAIAATLIVGEPCPVCLYPVEQLPTRRPPAALATQEKALQGASLALTDAATKHADASQARAGAESTVASLKERREELDGLVAGHPDAPDLDRLIAKIEQIHQKVEDARTEVTAIGNEAVHARDRVDGLKQKEQELSASLDRQRDPLVPLRPPPPRRASLADDWQALAAWAAAEHPAQEEIARKATEQAGTLRAERQAALAALIQACQPHGVVPEEPVPVTTVALHNAVIAAEAQANAHLQSIEEHINEAAQVGETLQEARQTSEVARLLAQLLAATGFERWLISEALEMLVQSASTTLRQLSGGQYSLACDDDGNFLVVDHRNADEKRSARTLSGGETFQASLALALALADQLAQLAAEGAAKLEAIFLDEGFGSLDESTLDTVANTIESLGAGDRMVGIVTHVRELADRVPVRYQVTKDTRTSTVERVMV